MQETDTPTEKPRITIPGVAVVTILVAASAMAFRLWRMEPFQPKLEPRGAVVLPFALLFGLGVAMVLNLVWVNRHRWRKVLRPSRGRVIGAIVLAALTPFGLIGWLPFTVGALVVMTVQAFLNGTWTTLDNYKEDLAVLGATVFVHLFWFAVSCLIASGITSRWVRVATYTLMFWTVYGALVVFEGT